MKRIKIYLYNEAPEGILTDEIDGFGPIVINGNLDLIYNDKGMARRLAKEE